MSMQQPPPAPGIPTETIEQLRVVRDSGEATMTAPILGAYLDEAKKALPALESTADMWAPVRSIRPIGIEVEDRFGPAVRGSFVAALVADLAIDLAGRLNESGLPLSVMGLYPATLDRLATYLVTCDLGEYWDEDDGFLKDLRVAGGYSVPVGVLDVDLHGEVGRRSGLKAMVRPGGLGVGARVARRGGPPWYVIHSDSRRLEEFDEPGWDRAYERIADLLLVNPSVRGMVGTSWFYDPQLVDVSPRLTYLRQRPVDGGALLLRNGPGPVHTERATSASATRRRLAEDGSYTPVCYSIVWPRDQLLNWASSR